MSCFCILQSTSSCGCIPHILSLQVLDSVIPTRVIILYNQALEIGNRW